MKIQKRTIYGREKAFRNGNGVMTQQITPSFQFCNEGSTNFRSSAVEDHARSETHLRAVRATQQQNVSSLVKTIKEENVRIIYGDPGVS